MENGFVKFLKKNSVQDRLTVPSAYVSRYGLKDDAPLQVADFDSGIVYQFQLSFRPGQYKKPVFQSKGWRDFVKANNLKIGDAIYFWKEENGTFGIRVLKDYLDSSKPVKGN